MRGDAEGEKKSDARVTLWDPTYIPAHSTATAVALVVPFLAGGMVTGIGIGLMFDARARNVGMALMGNLVLHVS